MLATTTVVHRVLPRLSKAMISRMGPQVVGRVSTGGEPCPEWHTCPLHTSISGPKAAGLGLLSLRGALNGMLEHEGSAGSRQLGAVARVERVAQPVTEEVEGEDDGEDRGAGPHRHPRRLVEEVLRGVEHAAPGWRRRLLTKAEEGEACFGNDRGGDGERRLHHDRCEDVRQNVAQD